MSPEYLVVRQTKPAHVLYDVEKCVRDAINTLNINKSEVSGKNVGITVGSRGIDNLPLVVRTVATVVREHGGHPVIFAAMGSHGGGTPEGQREVLRSLGITEETVNAPVETCGDSVLYGVTDDGQEVWGNPLAIRYDKVILLNRVKMHTDFEDITESGLMKMMAIGIGNPAGARFVHDRALVAGYGHAIRAAASVVMRRIDILFGLAVTENWKGRLNRVEAMHPEDILKREKELLRCVKEESLHLPANEFDTLIIEEAGKNISGTGMDTKVIGRIHIPGQAEPESPQIKAIALLNLTDESHGNAIGIGLADIITKDLFDKVDIGATMLNAITSNAPKQGNIPCVAPDDKTAIELMYKSALCFDENRERGMLIKNTGQLEYIALSRALYESIKGRETLEPVSGWFTLRFDDSGRLVTDVFNQK